MGSDGIPRLNVLDLQMQVRGGKVHRDGLQVRLPVGEQAGARGLRPRRRCPTALPWRWALQARVHSRACPACPLPASQIRRLPKPVIAMVAG